MRKNLILPNNGVLLDLKSGERLYFLAGPAKGAPDWQTEAIKALQILDPNCFIVCPRYYDEGHENFELALPPTYKEGESASAGNSPILSFEKGAHWDRYYMEIASFFGCIIFWLPCEDQDKPRPKEFGPYAQDTYGEIGRWSIKMSDPDKYSHQRYDRRVNVVMGAEPDFPGLSVIKVNIDADLKRADNYPFVIHNSLEDTLRAANRLARKTNPSPMNYND